MIDVYVYSTSIKVKCNHDGTLHDAPHVRLVNFTRRYTAMIFDHRMKRWVVSYRYMHYDKESGLLSLPRYALDEFIEYVKPNQVDVKESHPTTPIPVDISLNPKFAIRPEQQDLIDFLTNPDLDFKPLSAQTGVGKMAPHYTKIKLPVGWTTMGEIQVGDVVWTPKGLPVKVLAKYPQGVQPIWRIEFEDGRTSDCGKDHLWKTHVAYDGVYTNNVLTTEQISSLLKLKDIEISIPTVETRGGFDHLEQPNDPSAEVLFTEREKDICSEYLWFHGCKVKYEPSGTRYIRTLFDRPMGDHKVTLRITNVYQIQDKYEECSCILIDDPDHLYITDDYIVTHNTFCSAVSISKIGLVSLILTSGLVQQWHKELLDKTNLKSDDIYVIQGNDSLRRILDSEGYYPKVFLGSLRTMTMYAQATKLPYSAYLPYEDFLIKFGVGIKIIDEVHENFFANVMIDLKSNVKHNIYLSASYERSDPTGERIFNAIFPKKLRYGDHLANKYTTVVMLAYELGVDLPEERFCTVKGYNHSKYEQYLMNSSKLLSSFLEKIVNTTLSAYFFPNRVGRQKCLFVVFTTEMMEVMIEYITRVCPGLNVISYSGMDEPSKLQGEVDIVVGTIKKCSTGLDIKGLKIVANTISFKALPLAKQLVGRLRKIEGEETIFLDFYNRNLDTHQRHKFTRSNRYKDLAAKYYETYS